MGIVWKISCMPFFYYKVDTTEITIMSLILFYDTVLFSLYLIVSDVSCEVGSIMYSEFCNLSENN
jgi:hypothetical protein